jgi:hypothetical protein
MGGVVEAIVDVGKSIVKGAVGLVKGVVSALTSPFGTKFDAPDQSYSDSQSIQGVLLNKDSAISNIPVVYGTRLIGGTRVFVSTNGDNNRYLYLGFVVAEGQCNGFVKLYVDDNEVPLDSYSHGVVASPTATNYAGRLQCQFFDGRDGQVSSSILKEAPGWGDNHRLAGLCYLALRFEWVKSSTQEEADKNPYGGGIPDIKVVIQGKKIFDATTLGSTHTTAYDNETVTFNNNPASVLLDYMRNERYGKGLANDVFDWSTFKTAATLCDQVVTYTSTTTGKAFTCDAVLDTGQSLMTNIKIILQGFRGIMPYQQGKYQLKIEHGGDDTDITATPGSPDVVFSVTEDEIIGGLNIEGENKESKINRCRVTYVDPDADYQPNEVIWPEDGTAEDTQYLSEDHIRLEKQITLITVAQREQAIQYAEVFVKRTRSAKILQFNTTIASSNITVGDLIRVTNDKIGLDGIFRVTDIRIQPTGEVEISCIEHQSSVYAIQAKPDDIVRPVINLPDPLVVSAPSSVIGTIKKEVGSDNQTVYKIEVSWTASTDPYLTNYLVQYKLGTDAEYVTAVTTTSTNYIISPVTIGQEYNIRVSALNSLQRRSEFVYINATSTIKEFGALVSGTTRVGKITVTLVYEPASGISSTTTTTGSTTTITGNWGS